MYLLDTDTSIDLTRGHAETISRYRKEGSITIFLSSISHHELLFGALHSQASERHLRKVAEFVAPLTVLSFSSVTANCSSKVKEALTASGKIIGPLDILIAGCALEHELILVTNNIREFSRVPGLEVESWS